MPLLPFNNFNDFSIHSGPSVDDHRLRRGTATASGCGNSGENSANTHRMSIGDIHSYSLLVRRVVYANGCLGYAFKQTDNGRV